ncbi:hypothetical protein FBZ83_1017 [Azospirillum brasilense]|uniref:Uncharacterized protein n=1 Tax=Azospirillum brasilense TaxID=192 RepID=A0A560CQM2_AZOBR|nr:hypothetical protein [Azospirillum brasilense]TWA87145.1 hypothetical protein FBZ83_1017 [Azospirillum brasilense]
MATLLQIVGILSMFGGFLIGMSGLPNPAALLAGAVSGLLSLIVFWWMAGVLTGIRGTEESVEEAVEVLKQIAASVAPKEADRPARSGDQGVKEVRRAADIDNAAVAAGQIPTADQLVREAIQRRAREDFSGS